MPRIRFPRRSRKAKIVFRESHAEGPAEGTNAGRPSPPAGVAGGPTARLERIVPCSKEILEYDGFLIVFATVEFYADRMIISLRWLPGVNAQRDESLRRSLPSGGFTVALKDCRLVDENGQVSTAVSSTSGGEVSGSGEITFVPRAALESRRLSLFLGNREIELNLS